MEKETLVNHLAELPALFQEWREYSNCWTKDWLIGEELTEYEGLKQIESDIDRQVDEAEHSIIRPLPDYPKEYKAMLAQLAELVPYIKQVEMVRRALSNLDRMVFPQAQEVTRLFWNKSVAEIKYQDLSATKDRREYANSKVTKIRLAVYEVFTDEVKKIATQTRERLEAQHTDSLKRKRALEQLARSRQQEKLQPINARIKELLAAALN
ncbi:hypothetical protein LCGC14_2890980 [marine sediment metagenome]|uniref:Uncharacterized protein n=1 Tax=marine sediment metagenome TaxID=412755 RepID=A0A0F9ANC9_9ZZZZ